MFILQFDYQRRPLSAEAMIHAALNALLLVKLYWCFNNILMKPLKIASRQFSEIYQSIENSVDLMTQVSNGAYPGAENIDNTTAQDLTEMFQNLQSK